MKVGFTGTQKGMSHRQRMALRQGLIIAKATEFHHGDCVGADFEADEIARSLGIHIVIHPPDDPKKRAFCYQKGDTLWATDSYLNRNKDIVDATDRLVATPQYNTEVLRSGTWSTVRYAQRVGKPVSVLTR